mmetsp:Transcript_29213/g.62109  ORF Transcript_29213/g.62109 Transcript_29213/m.62109 type:complete len:81 (+) Transcript_29213:1076-1318(+)
MHTPARRQEGICGALVKLTSPSCRWRRRADSEVSENLQPHCLPRIEAVACPKEGSRQCLQIIEVCISGGAATWSAPPSCP